MIDLEPRIRECGCGGGGGAPAAKHVAKARQMEAEIARSPLPNEVLVQWTNPTKGNSIAWGKGGGRRYFANLTFPFPMNRTDAEGKFKDKVIVLASSGEPVIANNVGLGGDPFIVETAETGDKPEEPKAEVSAGV